MDQVPAHPLKTVAVFGAGIAGLTVAHELARRGWLVSVYGPNAEGGGFFLRARRIVLPPITENDEATAVAVFHPHERVDEAIREQSTRTIQRFMP